MRERIRREGRGQSRKGFGKIWKGKRKDTRKGKDSCEGYVRERGELGRVREGEGKDKERGEKAKVGIRAREGKGEGWDTGRGKGG